MHLTDKNELVGKFLKDVKNPETEKEVGIVFDELGNLYEPKVKSYRPFIIFYNEEDNSYYYVKARGAKDENGKFKRPRPGEVLIKQATDGSPLLSKDSYVDCSQIFKIDADYLESLIDFDSDLFKKTNKLCDADMCIVVKGLLTCAFEDPSYFSISEVNKGENGLPKARSLYLCKQKYNDMVEDIEIFYKRRGEKYSQLRDEELKTLSQKCPQTEEHQNNGRDFAKMIVEHFKKNEKYVEAFKDPNVPGPFFAEPTKELSFKKPSIASDLETSEEITESRAKPVQEMEITQVIQEPDYNEEDQEIDQEESLESSQSYQDTEPESDINDDVCSNNYWDKDKEDDEEKDKGRGR